MELSSDNDSRPEVSAPFSWATACPHERGRRHESGQLPHVLGIQTVGIPAIWAGFPITPPGLPPFVTAGSGGHKPFMMSNLSHFVMDAFGVISSRILKLARGLLFFLAPTGLSGGTTAKKGSGRAGGPPFWSFGSCLWDRNGPSSYPPKITPRFPSLTVGRLNAFL